MNSEVPIWLVLVIAFLATEPWRWAGVFLSRGLDSDSEIIRWVRAVSTALIAALIMRLLLTPPGILAETPVHFRIVALIASVVVFVGFGKRLILSIACGLLTFLALIKFSI